MCNRHSWTANVQEGQTTCSAKTLWFYKHLISRQIELLGLEFYRLVTSLGWSTRGAEQSQHIPIWPLYCSLEPMKFTSNIWHQNTLCGTERHNILWNNIYAWCVLSRMLCEFEWHQLAWSFNQSDSHICFLNGVIFDLVCHWRSGKSISVKLTSRSRVKNCMYSKDNLYK